MKRNGPIIAIDGPVGVGKSTVAKNLAERLGYLYIDTGAMYRAITLKVMRKHINPEDTQSVADLAENTQLRFTRSSGNLRILCDGEDVSDEIRLPEVSANTSSIADNLAVRERMVTLQREMGSNGKIVMEGRDIGTIVFPDAEIKIYLDADPKIRAERRYLELRSKGKNVSFEETLNDLLARDQRDASRPVGGLKKTSDSIVVDTTNLSQEEVIDTLEQIVHNKVNTT